VEWGKLIITPNSATAQAVKNQLGRKKTGGKVRYGVLKVKKKTKPMKKVKGA